MIDNLPAWLWIPLATGLWAFLALDWFIRRYRRVSAHFDRALAEWRECRDDYDLVLYAAYEAAAEACRDALVNAAGRRAGIEPLSLFMGNAARAYAYASPELVEWWEMHPRLTFAAFERQWIAQREYEVYA